MRGDDILLISALIIVWCAAGYGAIRFIEWWDNRGHR